MKPSGDSPSPEPETREAISWCLESAQRKGPGHSPHREVCGRRSPLPVSLPSAEAGHRAPRLRVRVYKALLAQFQACGISAGLSAAPGICLVCLSSLRGRAPWVGAGACASVSVAVLLPSSPSTRGCPLWQTLLMKSEGPEGDGIRVEHLTLGHTGCPTGEKTGLWSCTNPVGGRGRSIRG